MSMEFASTALFLSFAALALFVPLILLAGSGAMARRLAISLILAAGLACGVVAVFGFVGDGAPFLNLSWVTPFRFVISVDRLSGFFLLLISSVAVPVTIFAAPYFDRHCSERRRRWMWAFFSWFLLSMIVVVTASSGFAFLAGWELMTLVSAALILIEGDTPERRHNVFIYLLMMHAGAAAVAAAFFLFLPYSHSLDFSAMRAATSAMPGAIRVAIFLSAFVGFGAKAGLIPLHLWLPRTHPIAPSPVSALMSGIMLKTAVYGFVRFAFDFLGGGPWWSGYVVLLVAGITGVLGILYAISENDLKRLLAYSSVENIGIVFMGLGASLVFLAHHAALGAALALVAALLHAYNHALFKSLLFLGAGSFYDATHTLNLNRLGGLQRRMPFTGAAMLVGCCSIAGLPLFNGFVSEWLTFRSLLAGSTLAGSRAQIVLPLFVGYSRFNRRPGGGVFCEGFRSAVPGPGAKRGGRASPRSPSGHARGNVAAGRRLHLRRNIPGHIVAAPCIRGSVASSRSRCSGRNTEHRSRASVGRLNRFGRGCGHLPIQAKRKNRADVGLRSSGTFDAHAVHVHRFLETDPFCLCAGLPA